MIRSQYIHLGIALVVFGGAIGLVVASTLMVNAERTRAAALAGEVATKRLETMRVAAAKAALPALAADETAINQYFVKPDDIVPFLEKLQAAGKAEGAVVEVLSVGNGQGSDHRIALSLRITGSFESVMRTVGGIEYSPYDIVLGNLTLDTQGTKTKAGAPEWTGAAVFTIGTQPNIQATSTKK